MVTKPKEKPHFRILNHNKSYTVGKKSYITLDLI